MELTLGLHNLNYSTISTDQVAVFLKITDARRRDEEHFETRSPEEDEALRSWKDEDSKIYCKRRTEDFSLYRKRLVEDEKLANLRKKEKEKYLTLRHEQEVADSALEKFTLLPDEVKMMILLHSPPATLLALQLPAHILRGVLLPEVNRGQLGQHWVTKLRRSAFSWSNPVELQELAEQAGLEMPPCTQDLYQTGRSGTTQNFF